MGRVAACFSPVNEDPPKGRGAMGEERMMKRLAYIPLALGLALVGAILIRTTSLPNSVAPGTQASGVLQGAGTAPNEVKARVATADGHLPLYFEANQGQ